MYGVLPLRGGSYAVSKKLLLPKPLPAQSPLGFLDPLPRISESAYCVTEVLWLKGFAICFAFH